MDKFVGFLGYLIASALSALTRSTCSPAFNPASRTSWSVVISTRFVSRAHRATRVSGYRSNGCLNCHRIVITSAESISVSSSTRKRSSISYCHAGGGADRIERFDHGLIGTILDSVLTPVVSIRLVGVV